MQRIIPIRFGPRRTIQDTEFVDCPPVIDVHISVEREWSTSAGILPKHNGLTYAALIDTGAEATIISSELASTIGAIQTSKATIHGFDGTQEISSTDVHIVIPSQNIVFSARAGISSLTSAGHTFSLVLGRSFLQHCRLEVEGQSGIYRLWWVG